MADSIPIELILELRKENELQKEEANKIVNREERKKANYIYRKRCFGKFDKILDGCSSGPVWLKDKRIANIVADAFKFRDGKDYGLLAYCIMPNHVHVLFNIIQDLHQSTESHENRFTVVTDILKKLKGSTAREANKILHRTGPFWQHESYDHVVRNDRELENIIDYVLMNPVKAGLVKEYEEWEWSYLKQM